MEDAGLHVGIVLEKSAPVELAEVVALKIRLEVDHAAQRGAGEPPGLIALLCLESGAVMGAEDFLAPELRLTGWAVFHKHSSTQGPQVRSAWRLIVPNARYRTRRSKAGQARARCQPPAQRGCSHAENSL